MFILLSSISSYLYMKLTIGSSAVGGSLLRIKSFFVFIRIASLKLDSNLKLNEGSDKFRKGSNWYTHRAMGILDLKELIAVIMKSWVEIEHPSDRIIKVSGGETFLVSGYLHSIECFSLHPLGSELGLVVFFFIFVHIINCNRVVGFDG